MKVKGQDSIFPHGLRFNSQASDGDIFVTGFEDSNLEAFTNEFLSAEQNSEVSEIYLWISSYGGNVHNCLAMIDLIASSTKPLFTIILGKAFSAGCLLAAAGRQGHRFATQNSYLLIHQASGGYEGKTQDVIQSAKDLTEINDKVFKLLAQYTGKPVAFFKKLIQENHNTDLTLDTQEALKMGLIDVIGIPKRVFTEPQKASVVFQSKKSSKKRPKKG